MNARFPEGVLLLVSYAGVARSCSASSYRVGTINPALITVIMQCDSSWDRLGVGTHTPWDTDTRS
jgi:hypothetical protein